MQTVDTAEIARMLAVARGEHRELDARIARLHVRGEDDEITVKRMKKQKLQLKDRIAQLESALIPDQPA